MKLSNDESPRATGGLQSIESDEAGASVVVLSNLHRDSQPPTRSFHCHRCGANLATEKMEPQQMSIEVNDRPICEPCKISMLWQETTGRLFDSSVYAEVVVEQ
jgi:hypothetical protein